MIEDIKKEIEKELKNMGKTIEDDGLISIGHLFEILDKYKDIDKYKNAWEELKDLHLKTKGVLAKEEINSTDIIVYSQILELEQKHNISKEME